MRAMLGVISEGLKDVMVMLCELIRTKDRDKGGQRPRGEQFNEELSRGRPRTTLFLAGWADFGGRWRWVEGSIT